MGGWVIIMYCLFFAMVIMIVSWLMAKDAKKNRGTKNEYTPVEKPDKTWTKEKENETREEYEDLDPNDLSDAFNDMLDKRRGDTGNQDNGPGST